MRELVPGDLVALKGGDVIPADCKASVACQGLFEVNPSVRRRMQVMRAQEGVQCAGGVWFMSSPPAVP